MTDRELLLAAVLAEPGDDLPRLAFADCIDGEEPERAEFVRVQVELARIAPEPKRLGSDGAAPWAEMTEPAGPDYFVFHDAFGQGVRVGDRVDVKGRRRGDKNPRVFHGRLVRRVEDRGSDGIRYVVVRDAGSVPWSGKELKQRQTELFAAHGADWFGRDGCLTPPNDRERAAGGTFLVVRRGFIAAVHLPVAGFTREFARRLFNRHPVEAVTLTDREPALSPLILNAVGWAIARDPSDFPVEELGIPARDIIPLGIGRWLPGAPADTRNSVLFHCWYQSRESALLALSDAGVRYGRSVARPEPAAR